jgi:arylsulfatase A-like enzyme
MNGMASAADEVLGNLTVALKAKDMWQDTLLVYTSDNGGPAGQASSGHSGNNFPLRGGKTNVFEGGIRVSWIQD